MTQPVLMRVKRPTQKNGHLKVQSKEVEKIEGKNSREKQQKKRAENQA
jgi:hypothetical protein